LNKTIADAVADVNAEGDLGDPIRNNNRVRFTFVDVNTGQSDAERDDQHLFEPSRRKRHNLCAADPWLNGITTSLSGGDWRPSRSFHPEQDGHDAEGFRVAQRIRELRWDRLAAGADSYDWANATLPAGSCSMGGWSNPSPTRLHDSASDSIELYADGTRITGAYLSAAAPGPAEFGDLDGDGSTDAVMLAFCSSGAGGSEGIVLPLRFAGDRLELIGGRALPPAGADLDRSLHQTRTREAHRDGRDIVATEYGPSTPTEPQCCFTAKRLVRWRWDGARWNASLDGGASAAGL